jgi:hypothetical protein
MKKFIILVVILIIYSCSSQKEVALRGYLEFPRTKIVAALRTETDYIPIDYAVLREKDLSQFEGKFVEIKGHLNCADSFSDQISISRQVLTKCWLMSIKSIREIQKNKK